MSQTRFSSFENLEQKGRTYKPWSRSGSGFKLSYETRQLPNMSEGTQNFDFASLKLQSSGGLSGVLTGLQPGAPNI